MRRLSFKKPSAEFSKADLRRELRRGEKATLNAEIKALRDKARDAARARDKAAREAKQKCVAKLKADLAKLNQTIRDARERIAEARKAKLEAKVRTCQIEANRVREEAQAMVDLAKKKRDKEIAWRAEQKRLHQGGRARGEMAEKGARRESDQEVEWNLEAEDPTLIPIWQKLKRGFKQRPNMSRTEAFLEHVQKHEEEIAAMKARAVPTDDEYADEMARHYARAS